MNGPKLDIKTQNKKEVILEYPNQLCVMQPFSAFKISNSPVLFNILLKLKLLPTCFPLYYALQTAMASATNLLCEIFEFHTPQCLQSSTASSVQRSVTLDSDYNLRWRARGQIRWRGQVLQSSLAGGGKPPFSALLLEVPWSSMGSLPYPQGKAEGPRNQRGFA